MYKRQAVNQFVPRMMGLQMAEITTGVVQQAGREEKFTVTDPCCIIPDSQHAWTLQNFSEIVALHTPDGDVTLSATRDSAADISSISK